MAVPAVNSQKTAPPFPTIPVPENNSDALHRTCLALKQAVEMLTGGDNQSRDGTSANKFANHTFVQPDTPVALHSGDFWLCTGSTYSFSIWDGTDWLLIATLPTPAVSAVLVRAYRTRPDIARVRR